MFLVVRGEQKPILNDQRFPAILTEACLMADGGLLVAPERLHWPNVLIVADIIVKAFIAAKFAEPETVLGKLIIVRPDGLNRKNHKKEAL